MDISYSSVPFFSLYSAFLIVFIGFLVLESHYTGKKKNKEYSDQSELQKLFYYFFVGVIVFSIFAIVALPFIYVDMLSSPSASITYYNQKGSILSDLFNLISVSSGISAYLLGIIVVFLVVPASALLLIRKLDIKNKFSENSTIDVLYCVYAI